MTGAERGLSAIWVRDGMLDSMTDHGATMLYFNRSISDTVALRISVEDETETTYVWKAQLEGDEPRFVETAKVLSAWQLVDAIVHCYEEA